MEEKMKKAKWIAMILVVASIILCAIGCANETVPPHEHTFATEWESDATNHWHKSTCGHEVVDGKDAHSFGDYVSNNDATTEADGTKTRECSVCGKKDTVKDEGSKIHVHTFATEWTSDATNHWKTATCEHTSEVSEKAEHSYEWKITKNPTETEIGEKKEICLVCERENSVVTLETVPSGFVYVKGDTIEGAANTNNWTGVFVKGRTVTLNDFYMGKYEVTQEEYASVMAGQKVTVDGEEYELESNPNYCTEDSTRYTLFEGEKQEKRPVEGVTWYDAVWYCNALSEKEGLDPAYDIEVTTISSSNHITAATVSLVPNATGYRLPTEAEWEYAARGGDPTQPGWNYTFSGADTATDASNDSEINSGLDRVGWYSYNNITGVTGDSRVTNDVSGKGTHEVGKKAANRLGIYDMSGNVYEWCYDWYGTVDNETPVDGTASGSYRVGRGGSWFSYANLASVSSRYYSSPYGWYFYLGFRVVRPSSN